MATRAPRGSARSRGGRADADRDEFYNDEPLEVILPNLPPGAPGPPRRAVRERAPAAPPMPARPPIPARPPARPAPASRRIPPGRAVARRGLPARAEDVAVGEARPVVRARLGAEAGRRVRRASGADSRPRSGSHPRQVGVPHRRRGVDADRRGCRVRRAARRAERAGPAPGPPAGRRRAVLPWARDRVRGGCLGADGQRRRPGDLRPDQRFPRRRRVHGPGAARAARRAVHAPPRPQHGDLPRGHRLGRAAHRRDRPYPHREGHPASVGGRARHQDRGRPARLRGLLAAGNRAHPVGGDAAAGAGGRLRGAGDHRHAGAACACAAA